MQMNGIELEWLSCNQKVEFSFWFQIVYVSLEIKCSLKNHWTRYYRYRISIYLKSKFLIINESLRAKINDWSINIKTSFRNTLKNFLATKNEFPDIVYSEISKSRGSIYLGPA